jgi:hypothetical protein
MNALQLALVALRGISTLIGGVKIRGREGSELLNLLASLIEEGADTFEDLKAFTGTIETEPVPEAEPEAEEEADPTPTPEGQP